MSVCFVCVNVTINLVLLMSREPVKTFPVVRLRNPRRASLADLNLLTCATSGSAMHVVHRASPARSLGSAFGK